MFRGLGVLACPRYTRKNGCFSTQEAPAARVVLTATTAVAQLLLRDTHYVPIRFKDREQCVMLSQLRLWDGKRLTHKMGQLPDDQFEAVKQALRRLLK